MFDTNILRADIFTEKIGIEKKLFILIFYFCREAAFNSI